jgi:hypothetical protein
MNETHDKLLTMISSTQGNKKQFSDIKKYFTITLEKYFDNFISIFVMT